MRRFWFASSYQARNTAGAVGVDRERRERAALRALRVDRA